MSKDDWDRLVSNLKKLDSKSLLLVANSVETLRVRQEMEEEDATNKTK